MMRASRHWRARWGVRARVVAPVVVVCLLISLTSGWLIQRAHQQQSHEHVRARAVAITHAISHLAETSDDEVALQRFVAAMAAEKDIKLIVVAAADPLEVIAASRSDWVGMPASELPDPQHTYFDLLAAVHDNQPRFEFEHDSEGSVDFTVPLRTRMRASNPLARSSGAVMLHLDGTPHIREQAAYTASLLATLFGTIGLAALMAERTLSCVVLRPVKRIAHVARLTAEGDRTVRTNITGHDELGQLAMDIDQMIDELVRREAIELDAKQAALKSQREMEAVLAELACNNFALDQHSIVAITDLAGVITHANDKFCEISQYTRDELVGRTHRIVNSGYHPQSFWADMWRTVFGGHVWQGEVCNRAKDGSLYWVESTIVPYKDHEQRICKFVAIRTDITARKSFEAELRASEERFELAVRGSNDGIWDWTIPTGEVYYSARFKELLGYQENEFPHHLDTFRDHLHPEDAAATWQAVQAHLDHGDAYDVTYRLRTAQGAWRWFRAKGLAVRNIEGLPQRMAGSISDITSLKQIELQLARDALQDRLTGLPNRALLLDRLQRAIDRSRHAPDTYAVMFLDFDRFKLINDSLGHDAGDELLRQIAARLRETVRSIDSVSRTAAGNTSARLGGDEFVVLLEQVSRPDDALAVADRLLAALARPYQLGEHEVHSTASIGIVLGGTVYVRAEEVLRDADTAMYHAKRRGKACYAVFDRSMRDSLRRRQQIEFDLYRSIEADELELEYEPIVQLESGAVHSLEAHICWRHHQLGRIATTEFLPIAEESGLATPLLNWMLGAACRELARWRSASPTRTPPIVSLNLTPRQFASPDLVGLVNQAVERFQLSPAALHFEVPESTLARDETAATQQLRAMREHGFQVTVDHFGLGGSSFLTLYRLPVDALKLDGSILADVQSSREVASLIHGLAVIARNIGITLIVAGIQDMSQLIALQDLGCDLAQGRYFASPLEAEQVPGFLRQQTTRTYAACGAAVFGQRWAERLTELSEG